MTSITLLPENWGALRTLSLYRWSVTLLLLSLWWSGLGNRLLPGLSEDLLPLLAGLYLICSPTLSLSLLFRQPGYQIQTYLHAGIDISLTTVLVMVSGGMGSGLGILMLTPVGGIGTLIPRRMAILLAAIASLALIGEEILRDFYGLSPPADYMLAGLVGILTFVVSFTANTLAQRATASEQLAKQRSLDLANLSHVNERIIHHMAVGVIVLDEHNNIRMLNQAAARLLDCQAQPPPKDSIEKIAPPVAEQLHQWRQTGKVTHDGHVMKLGLHTVIPHFSRLGNTNGPALVFLEDGSRFTEQAQQIKLAALGRLTASVAHEIRNPLGAISHASQLIQQWENTEVEEEKLLDIIDRHTQRINQIIENILNLSRRQDSIPQSISLFSWLSESISEYRHTEHGKRCVLVLDDIQPHLEIRFDPGHLRQVLNNLWDNACQHGTTNNTPSIVRMSAGTDPDTGRSYLEVSDQGAGIAENLEDKIFEPFFTSMHDGTGLGLYLARELCECNQADIQHLPQQGGGARFRITFADNLEWAA